MLLTYLNPTRNSRACVLLFGNWRVGWVGARWNVTCWCHFLWKRKMMSWYALGSSILARDTITWNVLQQHGLNLGIFQTELKILKLEILNPNKWQQYCFCNHYFILCGVQKRQSCCIKYQHIKKKFIISISIMSVFVLFFTNQ